MNNPKLSTCCTCGFQWQTGQHGGHSCSSVLEAENTNLKVRIAELEKSLKNRPKHCEYIDEDGDIDIDKYLTDVNSWAFHVRRVLAIKEQVS
jgi:hypothetical protein